MLWSRDFKKNFKPSINCGNKKKLLELKVCELIATYMQIMPSCKKRSLQLRNLKDFPFFLFGMPLIFVPLLLRECNSYFFRLIFNVFFKFNLTDIYLIKNFVRKQNKSLKTWKIECPTVIIWIEFVLKILIDSFEQCIVQWCN